MSSRPKIKKAFPYLPLKKVQKGENLSLARLGESLIAQGKVGCLILAGGLGTRLGFKGPKGCFPTSPIRKKTLYQLLFEKIASLQKKFQTEIPLLLGVSSFDHKETLSFLRKHQFFGLKKSQITFIEQKNYPYLDSHKKALIDSKGHQLMSPNGNGGFYEEIFNSDLLEKWEQKGIQYLQIVPIDNPLLDPIDPFLLGHLQKEKAEAALKAISKKNAEEKVGLFVQKGKKILLIDYMEMPKSLLTAKDRTGRLKYSLANCGHYCLSISFLLHLKKKKVSLPIHWVEKKILVGAKEVKVWKGEKFIFDFLPYARKIEILLFDREFSYAPLKSHKGEHNPKSVKEALQKKDRLLYEKISGKKGPKRAFELSSEFWYPTKDLLKKWKGKPLPKKSYIEP